MSDEMPTTQGMPPRGGPPKTIGPYRILETLGVGGMGVVYLAEQRKPIRRKVALKVIKLGMDSKEIIGRFESERQALALMNHPGIARIFDAGTTEWGSPYFVMEHVPGISITSYCDKHRLGTTERLKLFIQVCRAVHHAHQKGIIHRDLKPSNVLVAIQDGEPVSKVIDFGVAKATQQTLTDVTVFTKQGGLIGTPEYMSPEQAEMTGLNIDTTTDIYSLGAILYELLTGQQPFERKELMEAGVAAIQKIIRDVDPPKPSTRISSIDAEESVLAARRHGTLAPMWRKEVRGELDWITMRAMEKDRSRRYPSASEFGADIQRCLQGEAVWAGPPSARYRLGKVVSRHRGFVAAAGMVLLALTLGLVVSSQLYVTSLAARNEALRESYLANLRAAQAFIDKNQAADARIQLANCPQDLRGWEWRHLDLQLNAQLEKTILPSTIEQVFVSPRASRYATMDSSGQWMVRDLDSGDTLCSLTESPSKAKLCVLSPDGTLYADKGMTDDGLIKVVDVDLCQSLVSLDPCAGDVDFMLIAPDGGTLATTGLQSLTFDHGTSIADSRLCLWSLPDGRLAGSRQDTSVTFALDFSPDSAYLAVCSGMGVVSLVDGRTGADLRTIATECYYGARFSRDGQWLALESTDKTVRIVSVESGQAISTFPSIGLDPGSLDFGFDDEVLAVAYEKGVICLWSTRTEEKLATYFAGREGQIGFSADGTRLISWSLQYPQPADRQSTIAIWDPFAGATHHLQGTGGESLVFSPDGRKLYGGSSTPFFDGRGTSYPCAIREWDTESGELRAAWRGHRSPVSGVTVSEDGEQVVSIAEDGAAWIWETALGTGRQVVEPDSTSSTRVASPWLAIANDDSLFVRDLYTLEMSLELPLAGAVEDGFVFAASGEFVAAGRGSGLKIWRSESGKQIFDQSISPAELTCLAFASDGRRLVAGAADGSLIIVDIGSSYAHLSDQGSRVRAVAWHPDGRRIASGLSDGIRIWDVDSGNLLAILSDETCTALVFSPDGRTLAGQSGDHITLWRTAPTNEGSMARRAYHLARRQVDPLLDRLFQQYQFADDVARQVLRDSTLTADAREYALRAVRVRGGDPESLELASWPAALVPGADRAQLLQALKSADAACELNPLHPTFWRNKGALQYRLGQLESARFSLARSDSISSFLLDGGGHPTTVAFLAMVFRDSGLVEESEETLRRLDELMMKPYFVEDGDCRRLYAEACGGGVGDW